MTEAWNIYPDAGSYTTRVGVFEGIVNYDHEDWTHGDATPVPQPVKVVGFDYTEDPVTSTPKTKIPSISFFAFLYGW